jgi:hypothetical protein
MAVALLALNTDMLTEHNQWEIVYFVWVIVTGFFLYFFYYKASFTDPGTIKSQIYLNQNTEESANHVARKN